MFYSYDQWCDDLIQIPIEQQPAWIKTTLANKRHLHIFGRFFFPNIIKSIQDVPECHLDLLKEFAREDDGAAIFPRGFAKSTWEKIDTIHDIIYNLEPVILYISDTLQDAKFHFESIKSELENNGHLRLIYGNYVPDEKDVGRKWTNTHFETLHIEQISEGNFEIWQVNMVARGAGKGRGVNIKNQRPTKIICDDVETDQEVKSAVRRETLHRWLYEVIFPSKDKSRGRVKMIGTVLHENAEILLFYKQHGGIYRQAIENGQSIWPNYYSMADLDRIREKIGSRAFSQEYMNNPTNDESANFKPEWIDGVMYTIEPPFRRHQMVITIDPQAGESGLADEYAITTLSWEEDDKHRYVTEQVAGRISQLEQAKETVRAWLRHKKKAKIVGVEKVLNQTAVFQDILAWKTGKINFNKEGMSPDSKEWIDESDRNIPLKAIDPGGKDKVARLQMHEAEFERGEIHLRPEMKVLRDQILFLGQSVIDHDDRADSLVAALDLSYKRIDLQSSNDSVYNKRANETRGETIGGNLYKQKF